MKPAWVLFLIIGGFWSLITTIVAIVRILSNPFRGDKLSWILISMVAFIGPVLWLARGRKLIGSKTPI